MQTLPSGAELDSGSHAAAKTGQDKKEHDKYCHFCQVWPTARAFPGEPALL